MRYAINPRVRPLRRARVASVLWLAAVALIVLSACGGDNESEDAAPADWAEEPAVHMEADEGTGTYDATAPATTTVLTRSSPSEAAEEAMAESGTDGEAALAVPTALTPGDLGRDIVYRATISVQADDVTAASNEAVAIVKGLGGIVFSQTTRTEPSPQAQITFKVLPADFSTALDRLAGVGKLVDQSISADDVTGRVVDLESRISTAETSVDRLRKLLEEAVKLEDVAEIERQLLDRETTLEVLRGQLRILRDQVDLATITLTINQSPTVLPDTGIEAAVWISDDADDPCLGTEHFTADPDSTVYFCLEVRNTGASTLTDVSVRSRDVRLDVGAFRLLQGGFERVEPGELLVAVLDVPMEEGRLAGRVATRGLNVGLEVRAVPVDAEGAALQEVAAESYVWLEARADDSLPGFADSVSDGASFLRTVVGVALVVVGVLVPFLPFVAVLAALIWWRRRRRAATRSERKAKPSRRRKKAEVPPPPAPSSAPEPETETETGFEPERSGDSS